MLHLDNDTLALEHADKLLREELEELYALKACKGRPSIVTNVMVLEKLLLALSGSVPDMESVEMPEVDEMIVSLRKLFNHGIITKDSDLGEQCLKYLACICINDGFVVLPEWLSSVQAYLDKMLPDYCRELFVGKNYDWFSKTKPWDDDDPISVQCVRVQTVNHLLSNIGVNHA